MNNIQDRLSKYMNLHFIVNPKAKNGLSIKKWNKIENFLKENKIGYKVYFTKERGDGKRITRNILENANELQYIYAVGGDGTVNEVVNGIHFQKNVIFGSIPAGSGNDFGRGFQIPKKLNKIYQSLNQFNLENIQIQLFDIGRYTGKQENGVFINNLGMGLDAKIAAEVNQSKLKPILNHLRLGKLVYIFYLIKEVLLFKPARLIVCVDGNCTTFEKAWFATVSNHPYFGGGMKISPNSLPNDGTMEITVVHNIPRIKILLLFITVFWGGHTRMKEVATLQGRKITLESEMDYPIHADGEYIGERMMDIEVISSSISILSDDKYTK